MESCNKSQYHELQFTELPFEIDGCTCYYCFSIIKPIFIIDNEEERNKYSYINIGIRIENVVWSDCCDDDIILSLKTFSFKDGVEKFQDIINKLNSKRKNNKIIRNSDGVELIDIEEYNESINYATLFDIELDKCYVCLEYCLPHEKLFCNHYVHMKCAYQLYKHNKNMFYKCGICRQETKRLYLSDENIDDDQLLVLD